MWVCICVYTCENVGVCMHACVYVGVNLCVGLYVCVCVCVQSSNNKKPNNKQTKNPHIRQLITYIKI